LCALESLACKTPVIALENTAIAEYLQDCKNGYVIKENPKDAINAILQIVKNKKMMGTNAHKVAQKYSVQQCTQKLLKVYEHAIEHYNRH
jgi:glycosyltransferase involved in cell wall biosynthesis